MREAVQVAAVAVAATMMAAATAATAAADACLRAVCWRLSLTSHAVSRTHPRSEASCRCSTRHARSASTARSASAARSAGAARSLLTPTLQVYLPAVFSVYGTLLKTLQADPAHAMVVDMATLGATDVALRLQIPLVLNNPSLPFSIEVRLLLAAATAAGALCCARHHRLRPLHQGPPFYIPAWGTGFRLNMTLWERCMNVLFPRLLSVALTPPFMQLNKVRRCCCVRRCWRVRRCWHVPRLWRR